MSEQHMNVIALNNHNILIELGFELVESDMREYRRGGVSMIAGQWFSDRPINAMAIEQWVNVVELGFTPHSTFVEDQDGVQVTVLIERRGELYVQYDNLGSPMKLYTEIGESPLSLVKPVITESDCLAMESARSLFLAAV